MKAMKETMIIKMNELMNNYREFKEAMKERFFFDDVTEVEFEVETGLDRENESGGQHFKSLYSAYKYVQEIFSNATNVNAEKYNTYCNHLNDYYKNSKYYNDTRDEIYCQINMFYTENGVEGIENLCNFEKMDENKVFFRNWL